MESQRALKILLIEDNRGDVVMFREALESAGIPHELDVIQDAPAAAASLRRCGRGETPCPDLVVLDLNLPGGTGREILTETTGFPAMRTLPIAILTTSELDRDIVDEFPDLRLDFATKTPHYDELVAIVRRFCRFARGPASPAHGGLSPRSS